MLPVDVEGITSSFDGQSQRRKVESDGEDLSDSEGDESEYAEEEEEGVESGLSARTRPKSRTPRQQLSSQKGKQDDIECKILIIVVCDIMLFVGCYLATKVFNMQSAGCVRDGCGMGVYR